MDLARIPWFQTLGITKRNGFATLEPLARRWLIMASLPRQWLAFARSFCRDHGKIMARSWQSYHRTCHGSWQGCHGFEHWDYTIAIQ